MRAIENTTSPASPQPVSRKRRKLLLLLLLVLLLFGLTFTGIVRYFWPSSQETTDDRTPAKVEVVETGDQAETKSAILSLQSMVKSLQNSVQNLENNTNLPAPDNDVPPESITYDAYANLKTNNHIDHAGDSTSLLTRTQLNNEYLVKATKLQDISDVNESGLATNKILKWNGTEWIVADDNDTDTNTTYTASNGLTLDGTTFKLGGTLTANTSLDLAGFAFTIDNGDVTVEQNLSAARLDGTTIYQNGNQVCDMSGNCGGGGGIGYWTLAGDSGTSENVNPGDTATFVGGAGLSSVVSATDTLTFNIGAGNGITVGANDVSVDQSYAFNWTGAQSWSNTATFNGAADFNGDLSFADTDIAFDGAATNFSFTGNFSVNTNDLFVQKSDGNVGINTTTPAYALDVNGMINGANGVRTGDDFYVGAIGLNDTGSPTTSGAFLIGANDEFTNSSSTNVQGVLKDLDTALNGVTGSSHSPVTLAGAYDYLTLLGQQITLNQIDLTTDVSGILPLANGGTNADLSGVSTGGFIYRGTSGLEGSGSLTGVIKGNGSSAPTAMTGSQNYVTRWTDAESLGTGVLYDDAVNVGVGSSAPSEKLDVAGAIRFGTAGAGNVLNTSAGSAPTGNLFWGNRTVCDSLGSCDPSLGNYWRIISGAISPANDTLDFLIASTATSSAKFAVLNVNSGTPLASVSSGISGTSAFITSDGTISTTRRMALTIGNSSAYDTTGNVLINPNGTGNVGIGTSNPVAKLDVNGTSRFGGIINTLGNWISGDGGAEGLQLDATGNLTGSGTLTFQGTGTSSIAGNLGVGTTAPNTRLDVAGYIKAPGATLSATYAGGTALTLNAGPSATADIVRWNTSTGTQLGVIASGGSFGIGTSSPQSKIDVRATSTEDIARFYDSGNNLRTTITNDGFLDLSNTDLPSTFNQVLKINNDVTGTSETAGGLGNGFIRVGPSGRSLANFVSNNTTNSLFSGGVSGEAWRRFVITGGGDFQIGDGTAAMDTFLGRNTTGGIKISTSLTGSPTLMLKETGGQTADLFQVQSSGGSAGDFFVVDGAGNVGIGSTSPSNKLDVLGGIRLGTAGANNTLSTTAAGGSPTGILYWGDRTICDSSGTCAGFANFWRVLAGAISPVNDTLDFMVGATATDSAKFAVLNVNNGTPLASVSSGLSGVSSYLTADGTLGTTRRQTLTIGNSSAYDTTGNVVINPNGTGNVGIGTTNATQKLDVLGAIRLGAASANNVLNTSAGSTPTGNLFWGDRTICDSSGSCPAFANFWRIAQGAISPVNDTLDFFVGNSATASAKFAVLNVNNGTPLASVSSGVSGTSMYMTADGTLATSGRKSLIIGNSSTYNTTGNVFINPNGTGNVAIGTTTPTTRLTVEGPHVSGIGVASFKGSANLGYVTLDTTTSSSGLSGFVFKIAGTKIGELSSLAADNSMNIYNNVFSANPMMTFSSGGNVGVGTSSPKGALDVAGYVGAAGATLSAKTSGEVALTIKGGPSGTADLVRLQDSAGSTLSIFNSAGNLGLGTTSASQKLDVLGAIRLGAAGANNVLNTSAAGGSPTGALFWGDRTICDSSGTCPAFANYWRIALGAISPVNDTLDLLIGSTATDSAKFAVLNVNNGTPLASVSSGVSGNGSYLTADGTLGTTRRQSLIIGNSSTYNTTGNIFISPNGTGNVSIGTTDSAAKLSLVGSADVTQFLIKANATQSNTSPIILVQDSTGTEMFRINGQDTRNLFIGAQAGRDNVLGGGGGHENTFIGGFAGANNVSGKYSTALGYQALQGASNASGEFNVAIGGYALAANDTGESNTAVGFNALSSNALGSNNTVVGSESLPSNEGSDNATLGRWTGYSATSIARNVLIGEETGFNMTSGANNNVLIGYQAGLNLTTGTNNIILGYGINTPSSSSSNTLSIGNLIFGNGVDGTGTTVSSGNIGIGTSTLTAFKLTVAGSIGPSADDSYDLGSDTARFRDLYLGGETMHIGTSTTDEGTISYDTTNDILGISTDSTTNGDIAFNTDSLYLDKSAGNVGINSATPGQTLDVVGNVRISGLTASMPVKTNANKDLVSAAIDLATGDVTGILPLTKGGTNADLSGVTTGGIIYKGATALAGSGSLTGVLKGNGSSAPTAMTGTTNYVTRWTDANTIGTGVLYDDGTNVGISTTNPANFKLEVAGNIGPTANNTYDLGSSSKKWANVYATTFLQNGNTVCDSSGNCSSVGNLWQYSNGAISPSTPYTNNTDLLIGATSTDSAKFAVLNIFPGSGTPTASVSTGLNGTAAYLTGDAVLASANKRSLTIGNTGTGNIILAPSGGTSNVGISTTAPASLFSVGSTSQFQINSSGNIAAIGGVAHAISDSSGNLLIDSNGTKSIFADDVQINGNDILDSGATNRISLGATTTLTNTTTTLSGTTTLTASSLATFTTASALSMGSTSTLTLASNSTINGGAAANDDLTLQGTSNATRTTSYVLLQPTAGGVGVGTTNPNQTGGGGKMDIWNSTTGTNDAVTVLNLTRTSTGTPANNIGARLEFNLPNASGALQEAATINTILTDVTAGSIDSAITFNNRIDQGTFQERMRIAANGNVGIGTTSPTNLLDVNTGVDKATATTTTAFSISSNDASNPLQLAFSLVGSATAGNRAAQIQSVEAGVGNRPLLINPAGSASNVSIGTTSIGLKKLEVNTTASTDGIAINGTTNPALTLYTSSTLRASIGVATVANAYVTGSSISDLVLRSEANKIHLGSGTGAPALTVDTTNNVGIGTVSPGSKLQTVGAIRTSGSSGRLVIEPSSGTANLWNLDNSTGTLRIFREDYAASGTGANGSVKLAIQNDGNVGVGSSSPNSLFAVGASSDFQVNSSGNIAAIGGVAHSISNSSGALLINANSTANLYIQSNGGNVAIGTTTANAKLTVRDPNALGSTAGNSQIVAQFAGTTGGNQVKNNMYLYRDAAGSDWLTTRWHDGLSIDASYGTPGSNTKTWWERDPNNDLQSWGTGASTYMTLNSSNLTLSEDLYLQGNRLLFDSYSSGQDSIQGDVDSGGTAAGSYPDLWMQSRFDDIVIQAGVNDSNLRTITLRSGLTHLGLTVDTDGNVGIGTTDAGSLLDVYDSTNADVIAKVRNASTGTAARTVFLSSADTASTGIYTYSSGYTTSGAQKTNGSMLYSNGTGGLSIAGANGTSGEIRFYTDGIADANQRMTITNAGNVGVGTTTPGAKFQVNGTSTLDGGSISLLDQTLVETSLTTSWPLYVVNDGDTLSSNGIYVEAGSGLQGVLMTFADGNASQIGSITFSGGTVSYNAFTGGHYVHMPIDVGGDKDVFPYGTLICMDSSTTPPGKHQPIYQGSKCSSAYQANVMGAYSNREMIEGPDVHLISAVGDGHVLVTNENGPIKKGDQIVVSSTPGYGMKANKAGTIVAVATDDWDGSGGKTLLSVFYYPGVFYPGPSTAFSSTGELALSGDNGNYKVTPVNGSTIASVLSATQSVFGKITSGIVNTKELVVSKTATIADLSVTNMSISGQSIHDYVASIVQEQLQKGPTPLPQDAIAQNFNSGMVINNYNTTVTVVQSPDASSSATFTASSAGELAINPQINVTQVTEVKTDSRFNILASLITWSEAAADGVRTLFINAPTTFRYLAWFQGPVKVNADTSGNLTIPQDTLKARVSFSKPFPVAPQIYVSFSDGVTIAHTITDVNETGFTINFVDAPKHDITLQWLALLKDKEETGPSLEVMETQSAPATVLPTPTPTSSATPPPSAAPSDATPSGTATESGNTGLSGLLGSSDPGSSGSATPSGSASPSASTTP